MWFQSKTVSAGLSQQIRRHTRPTVEGNYFDLSVADFDMWAFSWAYMKAREGISFYL